MADTEKDPPAATTSPDPPPPPQSSPSAMDLFAGLHVSDQLTPKQSNAHRVSTVATAAVPPLEKERVLDSAPVTDKLLGLLKHEQATKQKDSRPSDPPPASEREERDNDSKANHADGTPPQVADTPGVASQEPAEEPVVDVSEESSEREGVEPTKEEEPTVVKSFLFSGWFGSSQKETVETKEEPTKDTTVESSATEDVKPPATEISQPLDDSQPNEKEIEAKEEEEKEVVVEVNAEETKVELEDSKPKAQEDQSDETVPPDATTKEATPNDKAETPEAASLRKELDEQDKQHIDEAFHHTEEASALAALPPARSKPLRPRGLGEIHPDTPIPNSDVALRLLRRFAYKTRPNIITTYGGSKSRSLLTWLFGGAKEDPNFVPYRDLLDILYEEDEDRDIKEDSDRVVDAMLGETGDSMAKARLAVAGFVYLFSQWGHASSAFFEQKNTKSMQAFSELMSVSYDTASQLVAYGCLDGVLVGLGEDEPEYHSAANMLAQSVFNSDLSIERNELAAMQFLLSTGCRVTPTGGALLRGSHLLQTIRTLYHVYLTTDSTANKTTARAALQQIVTSVFGRMVRTDAEQGFEKAEDNFPSANHRDAFLVLRSVCKLSMRNLPDPNTGLYSYIGIQSSASNETWDDAKDSSGKSSARDKAEAEAEHERAQLVYTSAIHPALESKILALELLLYLLQNTDFSSGFIQRSGPQFHAAIRNYLCVSLLKNCTSDTTRVVNLSLRIFVPLVRNFRTILKNEIEAFVTNVFFVILDSKNSPAEHKSIVVNTFEEICSDPATLAEIFLNYDCDLSAVDLFHRIVNSLSKVARTGIQEPKSSGMGFMGGPSAARLEKYRSENRELRLDAMRALRQVLASLHSCIVEPMQNNDRAVTYMDSIEEKLTEEGMEETSDAPVVPDASSDSGKQNLVEIYGSKKKRRAEESEATLRFNQKPSAGIAFASKCNHIDGEDPVDVARYLLKHKDDFDKTPIGEYLGREAEYQNGFSLRVLHEYVRLMDFAGLEFDEAIRFFLSGFRLPGEAQKIDRIMEKFAERYTEQNPDVFPSADVAFILAFSIIMLTTDLHNPAIKEERKMTRDGFVRNNRGICDGQDLPEELLTSIFDRIKKNPISLPEDDEARERAGESKGTSSTGLPSALSPASFFASHYDELDRARETNFQKEKDHIVRTTESLLKRRRHGHDSARAASKHRSGKTNRHPSKFVRTEDSGLRDEYVSPMFEVTWGPALAAFSTAMESANGTVGALISIASDEELELAAENAAETIEVCLTGFRFAICTAGLCGNATARDAYMLALSRFSQLGTGVLLEPRHVRCVQTMLSLAREDGELLGTSWEHVFTALSEINRFHQLFHLMARNDRAAAAAAERRRKRIEEMEKMRKDREERRAAAEDGDTVGEEVEEEDYLSDVDSLAESDLFSDEDDFAFDEDMDAKAIDEANARVVYDAVSEAVIEAIYERSSSLSGPAVKEFVVQLCYVSRMEISVGGAAGQSVQGGDKTDLTHVSYRQQHALLNSSSSSGGKPKDQFHHTQPNIYNLQKLVEVTHYNMDSRPRLIFAELWTTVADHLTFTALHSNPALAMYAVDSFRQLSIQYLKRDELEVFEFQRRFLKPLETIMARSDQVSTKELLLNCIDHIIHVFSGPTGVNVDSISSPKGGLRSGWVPILTILGLGGRDASLEISKTSFKILNGEVQTCIDDAGPTGILLNEHFVETVNAFLMFVAGPHQEICLEAIDRLVVLTDWLADDAIPPPQLKRKATPSAPQGHTASQDEKQELELWWPILFGLSRAVGDARMDVRLKALESLVLIVNQHFFPSDGEEPSFVSSESDNIQTLQLIFRGVLTPMLEFVEIGSQEGQIPSLPEGFERFLTLPKPTKVDTEEAVEEVAYTGWLETTFDLFMDACVSICQRSITTFKDDSLIEDVFAILNSCLLSDSGSLAVRGLRRLEQFVSSDLDSSVVTDDVWATVSHMLRRCLSVRGLPFRANAKPTNGSSARASEATEEASEEEDNEYDQLVQEFIMEDRLCGDRRYIASNAAAIIGMLLTTERFTEAVGLRWRLFLIAGLGRGIVEWGQAASIIIAHEAKADEFALLPPDYRETALYGRKWMNRFLLQLASMKEVVEAPSDVDIKSNRYAAAQKLVVDETERLLVCFLEKERAAAEYRHTETDEAFHKRFTALVTELLAGYNNMDAEHLKNMSWINPILLDSCIQSKNEDIRLAVRKLVQRTSPFELTPYPIPTPPKKEGEKAEDAPPAAAPAEPSVGEPRPSDPTIPPQDEEVATAATGSIPSDAPSEPSASEENVVVASSIDHSIEEAAPAQVEEKKPASGGWNPMSWLGSMPGTAQAADSNGTSQNAEAVKDEMVEVQSEASEDGEDDSADESATKAEPTTADESQGSDAALGSVGERQSSDADPADESQSSDAVLGSAGESQTSDANPADESQSSDAALRSVGESQTDDANPADESQSSDAALGSVGESQSSDADPSSSDPGLAISDGETREEADNEENGMDKEVMAKGDDGEVTFEETGSTSKTATYVNAV